MACTFFPNICCYLCLHSLTVAVLQSDQSHCARFGQTQFIFLTCFFKLENRPNCGEILCFMTNVSKFKYIYFICMSIVMLNFNILHCICICTCFTWHLIGKCLNQTRMYNVWYLDKTFLHSLKSQRQLGVTMSNDKSGYGSVVRDLEYRYQSLKINRSK